MWEQIRSNRVRSGFVVAGMGVLLVATGVAVGALLAGGLTRGGALIGGAVALGVWLVLWLTAASKGDQVLLRMARASRISKQDHPRLWNVVEEMSIASRLGRMPQVYIIDDSSPNAFATGRRPDNAAVAVTTGLLRVLDRDELQGVIAHEIGHIKNRDVALMVTAGVMMGAIVLLAEVGIYALWFGGAGGRRSRTSGRGGGGEAAVMIVALVLMILAPILAQLIYFSLSRRREYLADASGALFTRYPEGLASALEKISGKAVPLSDKSRVTAPMYIVPPPRKAMGARARGSRGAWTSTHPPVETRIRILRSMGGGAGYSAYEQAYEQVAEKRLMKSETVSSAEEVPALGADERPGDTSTPAERGRMASDALLSAAGYHRVVCSGCEATVKIPAEAVGMATRCPRCRTPLEKAREPH